jgi:cyclase
VKRLIFGLVILVAIAAAGFAGYVYWQWTTLAHEKITDDLHVIRLKTGPGGNVAVLRTEAGTVLVDTMTFTWQADKVRELAEELTGKPVTLVINTHYHQDHTHGNPSFDAAKVVATENTRANLLELDGAYWEGPAAASLPDETFDHEHTVELGGKTIRLYATGPAHTDGDLVVLFVEDRTVHTGDLVFNGLYPNIDLEAGGSVQRWPEALELVLGLDFDVVIPGHGPLTDRNGVRRYQDFMKELAFYADAAGVQGRTLEWALAEIKLTKNEGLEDFKPVPYLVEFTHDFVIQRAWEETHGSNKAMKEEAATEEADEAAEEEPEGD